MMEIFEATPYDLKELGKLFDAYRQYYGQESDIEECTGFLSERMKNKDSVIYIAANEDETIAFAQLYPLYSSVKMKKMWLLNDLYVDAAFRRKGIARMLIEQCRKLSIETTSAGILLETGKSNRESNALYPVAGFRLVDESNYYFLET